jgi:hypothetical protein
MVTIANRTMFSRFVTIALAVGLSGCETKRHYDFIYEFEIDGVVACERSCAPDTQVRLLVKSVYEKRVIMGSDSMLFT